MKVITLIDNDFDIAAYRLSDMVMADFSPDLAVGVLSGGAVVANKPDCIAHTPNCDCSVNQPLASKPQSWHGPYVCSPQCSSTGSEWPKLLGES